MLKMALTKGRIEEKSVELLERARYDCASLREKGRRLLLPVGDGELQVVLAKSADVITYIEHGVCDVGIVGKDTILEQGRRLYEILDLGFGKCRFSLAAERGRDIFGGFEHLKIATKYPKVATEFFRSKGMDVEIIKIDGSVELAPLLGLADAIVDIVETGTTLRENGLEVVSDIAPITARMIVNIAAMKMKKNEIDMLADRLTAALREE